MIPLKVRNPSTGQFEDATVPALETPRRINGVLFDGSQDIIIKEKEVVISNTTPTDANNKLWISGIPGSSGTTLTVDWANVLNKPNWTGFMPTQPLSTLKGKILAVKQDETGFEYITPSAGGATDAVNVNYDNPTYPTVKAALDKLLYVPISVSLSGGNTYEIGTTITSVLLNWTTNKNVVTQSINNGIGAVTNTLRTFTHTGQNITTNRTYTITVNDGTQDATSSTSVNFLYKRYWGVTSSDSINNQQILSLNKEFSTTRIQNRTFDCSGGKYFWIVYPASFGEAGFKVGGLSFSDMKRELLTIMNESRVSVDVYIYRVNNIQTGSSINVEVL